MGRQWLVPWRGNGPGAGSIPTPHRGVPGAVGAATDGIVVASRGIASAMLRVAAAMTVAVAVLPVSLAHLRDSGDGAAGYMLPVSAPQFAGGGYAEVVAKAERAKPKVAVIGTGGTIGGVAKTRTSFTDYRSGELPVAKLVDELRPEIAAVADLAVSDLGGPAADAGDIAGLVRLTQAVDAALTSADSVVVTTGTDTMEELAYWLDLTVRSRKPVVVTGSMRPWTVVGSDGPANLFNAVVLAARQVTYCFGTVVMLNDEIHAAREVTKTNTYRTDTMQTRRLGALGWIDGEKINVARAPSRIQSCDDGGRWATEFDLTKVNHHKLPRVEIAYSYRGGGGEGIAAFAAAGVQGIVVAGMGAGVFSPGQGAALEKAVKGGTVFMISSRTGSGSVYLGGSGAIVAGEDLLPQKARILLLLALAHTGGGTEKVQKTVQRYVSPDFATGPSR